MTLEATIRERLEAAFSPSRLEVVNESALHAGHAGDDGTGESHWRVVMRAEALGPMSRVARHRAVNRALGDVMDRAHAMALDLGG